MTQQNGQATNGSSHRRTVKLHEAGQSAWLDSISACMIQSGELAYKAENGTIYGVTSNPTIFGKAIGSAKCGYPDDIRALRKEGKNTFEIYDAITQRDVGMAADVLRPVYDQTDALDGYVSLEVSPELAYKEKETVTEAKRLFGELSRPNIHIKVPATEEGIPAIRRLIGAGVNVNVTLIFSKKAYIDVAQAYIDGLRDRVSHGANISRVASVASVFVSRLDTTVDKLLDARKEKGEITPELHKRLRGEIAVANAKDIYQEFKRIFEGPEFQELAALGARPQRPLWASTGAKDPSYHDLKYVDSLVGPQTVNTLPEATLAALVDHGKIDPRAIERDIGEAREKLRLLITLGISADIICAELLKDGVKSFDDSFQELLAVIERTK